jgi:hypothetical protein
MEVRLLSSRIYASLFGDVFLLFARVWLLRLTVASLLEMGSFMERMK